MDEVTDVSKTLCIKVGAILAAARASVGLTLTESATKFNLRRSRLAKREAGEASPRRVTLEEIGTILACHGLRLNFITCNMEKIQKQEDKATQEVSNDR